MKRFRKGDRVIVKMRDGYCMGVFIWEDSYGYCSVNTGTRLELSIVVTITELVQPETKLHKLLAGDDNV